MTGPTILWHAEHVSFTRLLDLLEKQVAVFRAGEQPNYELMRDVVYYLRHYSDEVHHRQEEVAFARLLARDPEMKSRTDRLIEEHHVMAAAGETLLAHLGEVAAGALEPRSVVEAAAASYLASYRQHLAAEEKEIIPRAAELLTPQDWAAVLAAVPARPDPLFGEDIEARFRKLRRQITLDAQGT